MNTDVLGPVKTESMTVVQSLFIGEKSAVLSAFKLYRIYAEKLTGKKR